MPNCLDNPWYTTRNTLISINIELLEYNAFKRLQFDHLKFNFQ